MPGTAKSMTMVPSVDGDHGRIETRTATVATAMSWLREDHKMARAQGHRQRW